MRYRRRKKKKKRLINLIKILVILILILESFISFTKGYYLKSEKDKKINSLTQRLNILKKENKRLQWRINNLKDDKEIEKLAREMGFVKKGEVSFRIVEK
jgi:cell division protein FtsB